MDYVNIPVDFNYADLYNNAFNAPRGTKEFYLRAGNTRLLPASLKYLNYYMLLNDRAVYMPNTDAITRSTSLNIYFSNLTRNTRLQTNDERYNFPLMYDNQQLDSFNFKDLFVIHLINVTGQIQDTFERAIPTWARETETTEILGVSLALKLTPKHRIRVYTRNNHIIVFTTKGLSDAYENDYKLCRKLWACLPLLRGWITDEQATDCPDIVALCKALDNDDATTFWTLLENYFSTNPIIKDLKYSTIIQTFNNIAVNKQNVITRSISDANVSAARYLEEYAKALETKRSAERRLLELQQSDLTINVDTIKMLVDKKICYALDISRMNGSNGTISYRCSAPLLSYDKDAAQIVYNKRVIPNFSVAMQKLFKLLFLEEKVILMFDQSIDIRLNRGTFTAQSGCTNLFTSTDTSFPNPHHYYYNCWGSYGPIITKLINEYKLEELFYQVKAAMGSLNFSDPPVISKFLELLNDVVEEATNPKCFYWRDENCTTPHTWKETFEHFREETAE